MVTGFVCEVTPECNLNCIFCYNTWREPRVVRPSPLAAEAFADILIPTLRDSQAKWLAFAGGEPLLYPRLEWLMAQVSAALPHVRIGLLSNGISLSEKRLQALVQSGLQYVEISLFAASVERYQALTGSHLLKRAHTAILAVKALNLPLTVACTLLADQIDEFEKVALTAMALGADVFAVNPFTPTGYGQKQQDRLALSRAQLCEFLDKAQGIAQKVPMPIVVTLPIEDCEIPHADYPNLQFSPCQCASGKWVIDPEGYLRTCEQNMHRIGSLAEHTFIELSTRDEVKAFQMCYRKPECVACDKFNRCGGGCRFSYS